MRTTNFVMESDRWQELSLRRRVWKFVPTLCDADWHVKSAQQAKTESAMVAADLGNSLKDTWPSVNRCRFNSVLRLLAEVFLLVVSLGLIATVHRNPLWACFCQPRHPTIGYRWIASTATARQIRDGIG